MSYTLQEKEHIRVSDLPRFQAKCERCHKLVELEYFPYHSYICAKFAEEVSKKKSNNLKSSTDC